MSGFFHIVILGAIISLIIAVGCLLLHSYSNPPFKSLIIIIDIDASGRRQPSIDELLDEWVINNLSSRKMFEEFYRNKIIEWDVSVAKAIEKSSFFKDHYNEIFAQMRKEVLNKNYPIFKIRIFRKHTRYRQVNYRKIPYVVDDIEAENNLSYNDFIRIIEKLDEINFETTRSKYNAKNQRKLMTKELRRKIIERDNYTCQICGKYMPDEVGLHVDHIVAIKNGGKSVASNLQVLCDKCNLSKGKK